MTFRSVPADQTLYVETAPSGITVTSTKPFQRSPWDHNLWHLAWSWSSWGSQIARGYGWDGPRNLGKRLNLWD